MNVDQKGLGSSPAAVDVSSVKINPKGNCGDDASASTGFYRVETSTDGQTWTPSTSTRTTCRSAGQSKHGGIRHADTKSMLARLDMLACPG